MNHESRITNHAGRRGFTIIEMVVVLAIVSLMSAVTIVSLNTSKISREVESQARVFASAVREAQNYALTGKNITSTSGAKPCFFRVESGATGAYYIKQSNNGTCGSFSSGGTYQLGNAVSVSGGPVDFSVPRGEPWSGGSELSGAGKVDFSLTKNGKTAHVCVYPLGRVEETKAGTAGSEPQCP